MDTPICGCRENCDVPVIGSTDILVATPVEDDLPKSVDYNGIFKFCGKCKVCVSQDFKVDQRKDIISLICQSMKDDIHLSPDEYILGCCIGIRNQSGPHSSHNYEFITNYGRITYFHKHQYTGKYELIFSEHATPHKLSQEYITIISYLSSYEYLP